MLRYRPAFVRPCRDDVEDFFGFGVVVAIVAFAGEEDDFAEGEGGVLGLIGADESLDRTPIKGVCREGVGVYLRHLYPPADICLNFFIFSVMAISVGNRSMLEAPKNPTTPLVCSST